MSSAAHPFSFPLLADENIHPRVVEELHHLGYGIISIFDEQLAGANDNVILEYAHQHGRVVLTHDSDFGRLAILQNHPFTGIVFLRPGHIRVEFTLKTIQIMQEQNLQVTAPFILVAEHTQNAVNIRIRQL